MRATLSTAFSLTITARVRSFLFVLAALAGLSICPALATAAAGETGAEEAEAKAAAEQPAVVPFGILSDPDDPQNQLPQIRERGKERDSVFPVSPLVGLHGYTTKLKDAIYEASNMELALAFNHLFQGLSESFPGTDQWGTATDMDFFLTWELFHQGRPSQGQVFFQTEGRWDYGTTGPTDLGPGSLGSLNFTANAFAKYDPTFLVRNLYWQQGSANAGWFYRIGKITPDQILGTSPHLSPVTTFLPIVGTGGFTNALPDSGLGITGGYSFTDRFGVVAVISDANANRQNWGDLPAGDFYYGADLAFKIFPRTEKAAYSKASFWYTDGTKDGQPINGMAGPSGWGFIFKLEQELTADGRAIGIARYGKSFNGSALYEQLAGVHFLYYNPHVVGHIRNDVVGLAFNWGLATQAGARSEYNVEIFYRFPIFPLVDTTLSYQAVIHPALDPTNDWASAFSLRLRWTF
jgi:hypothetical protein